MSEAIDSQEITRRNISQFPKGMTKKTKCEFVGSAVLHIIVSVYVPAKGIPIYNIDPARSLHNINYSAYIEKKIKGK